jgi:hypothetical protein
MDPILKKAAEFADGMLDLISWMGNRMESKRKLASPDDIIGSQAEVTIPIKKGQTGEIIVVVEGGRLNYGARGSDPEQEFHKGEVVVISRSVSSIVYVEKRKESAAESGGTNGSTSANSNGGSSKQKKTKLEKTELVDDKHSDEGHS